jgi:hypothetical protein
LTEEKAKKKIRFIALQAPDPMGEPGSPACPGYSNRKPARLEHSRNIGEFFRWKPIWAEKNSLINQWP